MKKLFLILISLIMTYVTVSDQLYAMRTGATRRESKQAHYIALKQARMATHAISARNLEHTQRRTIIDPYPANSACDQFKWPTQAGHFSGCTAPHTKSPRLMSCLLMALILMQPAQVAFADDSPLKKAAEAVAFSGGPLFLGLGGTAAINGMATLMEKSSDFVVTKCEGILDGKLGAGADNFGRLVHEYVELEKTDPVKAQLKLSGITVLAKGFAGGVTGAITGGAATAPVGGEGAIPGAIGGALYSLAKGLAEETFGFVVGEALHKLTGNAIPEYVRNALEKFAPTLRYFDRTLTDEQTINYSILLGFSALSSTQITPIIKELGHIDLASLKFVLKDIAKDTAQSGLKDFGLTMKEILEHPYEGALEHGLYHNAEHGMQQTFEDGKNQGPLAEPVGEVWRQAWQEIQPFKEVFKEIPTSTAVKSYDFMGDAQKIIQHEQFMQWKAESTNLHISIPQGLDFVNQYLQQEQARPLWQYEGAAGNAWYNEQQARRRLERWP